MLLTVRTTHKPATDLGFLLHKNPTRVQSFPQSFGKAHVFYPEANDDACTAALLLDVDPVGLVRRRQGPSGEGGALDQYVNDRPYVASSFLSVAISDVFGTAMSGRSKERQPLAETEIPLEARIAVLPSKGGEVLIRRLFEPLGYDVSIQPHALDEREPTSNSRYFTVSLAGTKRLADLLSHVYVLLPVLDDQKHYWVGDYEVEKLLRHGQGWLPSHPERETITRRYLRHFRSLVDVAIERLVAEDTAPSDDVGSVVANDEDKLEDPVRLNEQRLATVLAVLKGSGANRVIDLGCGEGRLLKLLLAEKQFTEIIGMDVSYHVLETAKDRLHLDRLPPMQAKRIQLLHGSLMYRDSRLTGYDAAAVVEVIEHLDAPRLAAFERTLFEFERPRVIALTTPNVEYNVKWESLPAGRFRHRDHRFEWTREQFRMWSERVAAANGYTVRFLPVGPEDPQLGSPTQMAVFTLPDKQ